MVLEWKASRIVVVAVVRVVVVPVGSIVVVVEIASPIGTRIVGIAIPFRFVPDLYLFNIKKFSI